MLNFIVNLKIIMMRKIVRNKTKLIGKKSTDKIDSNKNSENEIIIENEIKEEFKGENNNNINIINNNSNSNGNSDNISNGLSNNSILTKNSNNNFTIEKKPKKKKYKFGFVELIFMKDDKFEIIQKKKPPQ